MYALLQRATRNQSSSETHLKLQRKQLDWKMSAVFLAPFYVHCTLYTLPYILELLSWIVLSINNKSLLVLVGKVTEQPSSACASRMFQTFESQY